MSIHVCCDWDGESTPEDSHIDAVIVALEQNHARLRSKWTPPVFMIFSPADSVMLLAAQILDICGCKPKRSELDIAVEQVPRDRQVVLHNFLKRVFKRLEFPDE